MRSLAADILRVLLMDALAAAGGFCIGESFRETPRVPYSLGIGIGFVLLAVVVMIWRIRISARATP